MPDYDDSLIRDVLQSAPHIADQAVVVVGHGVVSFCGWCSGKL